LNRKVKPFNAFDQNDTGTYIHVYTYLSKYTIEPDSYVPLFMVCYFKV